MMQLRDKLLEEISDTIESAKANAYIHAYREALKNTINTIDNTMLEVEKEQLCEMYVKGRSDISLDYYPTKHALETYNETFTQNKNG